MKFSPDAGGKKEETYRRRNKMRCRKQGKPSNWLKSVRIKKAKIPLKAFATYKKNVQNTNFSKFH